MNYLTQSAADLQDRWTIVCQEAVYEMRERPLAAGLQDQAANRLELPWSRARVVSVKEKARKTCQVRVGKTSASEPFDEASKIEGDVKTEE